MSRRVRSLGAVLLTLSLVLNVPTAFAAVRDRDAGFNPSFVQRIVRTIKKVLKPLMPAINNDEGEYKPLPPLP